MRSDSGGSRRRFGPLKVRIRGPLKVRTVRFFNTTFARIYKDGATWKESTSFGRDDLPLLGKVADMVHTWIFTHGQEHNGTQHQEPATAANEEF